MQFRLLFLVAACLVGQVLSTEWLKYVCSPATADSTAYHYSIINPNASYFHYAFVKGSGEVECAHSFSADHKTMNITNCEGKHVNVAFSNGPHPALITLGGNKERFFKASCVEDEYMSLAEIQIDTKIVDSPDFEDSEVEVSVRDLQGVDGYAFMTIGYPLTVELTGPAGSKMLPKRCVAYSVADSGPVKNKTIIEGGCSADESLIYDFQENLGSWFDRGLALPDDALLLLTEEEAAEGEESQPVLATHMHAFRFYTSNKVDVQCEVQLCESGSSDCDFTCS